MQTGCGNVARRSHGTVRAALRITLRVEATVQVMKAALARLSPKL